jgi:hypothetical protein
LQQAGVCCFVKYDFKRGVEMCSSEVGSSSFILETAPPGFTFQSYWDWANTFSSSLKALINDKVSIQNSLM